MRLDIVRLDVISRRRSTLAYAVGMALYTLVVVGLYPSFKDSTSLDKFITDDSTAAAIFGVTGNLTSAGGWLNGNIYGNFFPLVMLLLTIAYGAACLAGQDEDGTLCLLATLPLPRTRIVIEKAATMALQAAALSFAVAAAVFAGRFFDLNIAPGNVISISVATCLMGIDFGLIAMAIGAVTGRRATAAGAGAAVAAVSYLLNSLATVVSWMGWAKYVSLFYWSVGDNQIVKGVSLADYVVMILIGLCALYAAVAAFRRADLH
ncbi:MAG: ABC transporter permease subunit [Tepidiformaceae bacterium]